MVFINAYAAATASTATIVASDSGFANSYDETIVANTTTTKVTAPVFSGSFYLIVSNMGAGSGYVITGYYD